MVEMIAKERTVVKNIVIHKSVQSLSERTILDVKFNAKKLGKKQTFKK